MSGISITERCACGATLSVVGSSYRSKAGGGSNGEHRSAEEIAERWRVEHRHEMPPTRKIPRLVVSRPPVPTDGEGGE